MRFGSLSHGDHYMSQGSGQLPVMGSPRPTKLQGPAHSFSKEEFSPLMSVLD